MVFTPLLPRNPLEHLASPAPAWATPGVRGGMAGGWGEAPTNPLNCRDVTRGAAPSLPCAAPAGRQSWEELRLCQDQQWSIPPLATTPDLPCPCPLSHLGSPGGAEQPPGMLCHLSQDVNPYLNSSSRLSGFERSINSSLKDTVRSFSFEHSKAPAPLDGIAGP